MLLEYIDNFYVDRVMDTLGVMLPLFQRLGWPPELRRVCTRWRDVYDERISDDEMPLYKRWIKSEHVLARARATYKRVQWKIKGFVPTDMHRVHTLSLASCEGVVDVSALGNVHTLSLACCEGVVDVSALSKVVVLIR